MITMDGFIHHIEMSMLMVALVKAYEKMLIGWPIGYEVSRLMLVLLKVNNDVPMGVFTNFKVGAIKIV